MTIRYTLTGDGPLLRVKASGEDDSLEEVQSYGLAVIEAASTGGHTRILCDERELVYRLATFDTYEAARLIAGLAPTVGRTALVCNPACVEDARFWETVAVNRGLTVRVFQDPAAAEAWLLGTLPREDGAAS